MSNHGSKGYVCTRGTWKDPFGKLLLMLKSLLNIGFPLSWEKDVTPTIDAMEEYGVGGPPFCL